MLYVTPAVWFCDMRGTGTDYRCCGLLNKLKNALYLLWFCGKMIRWGRSCKSQNASRANVLESGVIKAYRIWPEGNRIDASSTAFLTPIQLGQIGRGGSPAKRPRPFLATSRHSGRGQTISGAAAELEGTADARRSTSTGVMAARSSSRQKA